MDRLVYYGSPVLQHPAEPVAEIDDEIRDLAARMITAMHEYEGIGFAAPQLGVARQVIVIESAQGPLVLINPTITARSEETVTQEEGCLSVPGVGIEVTRARTITVRARTLDGAEVTIEAMGTTARVIQHEIDHIQGRLVIDHATFARRRMIAGKLRRIARGEIEDDGE